MRSSHGRKDNRIVQEERDLKKTAAGSVTRRLPQSLNMTKAPCFRPKSDRAEPKLIAISQHNG